MAAAAAAASSTGAKRQTCGEGDASAAKRQRIGRPTRRITVTEPDGQASHFLHIPDFLSDYKGAQAFRDWAAALTFPSKRVKFVKHDFPRDMRWFAQNGESYRFSGHTFESGPWASEPLQSLAKHLTAELKSRGFDDAALQSVLVNRYRSGLDSICAHSDKERCLGKNPVIASVSLGATRTFRVSRKSQTVFDNDRKYHGLDPKIRVPKGQTFDFELHDGDLFVFAGAAQAFWEHGIGKVAALVAKKRANRAFTPPVEERLNFTFRPHLSSVASAGVLPAAGKSGY